jgi:hypothetical protein
MTEPPASIRELPPPLLTLVEACRSLNENLHDSLPMTRDIRTITDVLYWRTEVMQHLTALDKDLNTYMEVVTDAISE